MSHDNAFCENAELEKLIKTLKTRLKNGKGKKVYGYLPPEVKETVNAIFKEISKDKSIQSMYEKWCELERQKYKTYTQKEKEFPPLYENKVFHSVRNSIIGQVLNMDSFTGFFDYIEPEPIENTPDEDIPPPIEDNMTDEDFTWKDDEIKLIPLILNQTANTISNGILHTKKPVRLFMIRNLKKRIMRKPNSF